MKPNDDGPSPSEVARLAVRLLGTGEDLTSDPRLVSAAVVAARQLLDEAGKRPIRHACELFPYDVLMTYDDIAKSLKDYWWENLGVGNTFAKRINQILFELHRDIGHRRDFLASSFRSEQLISSPEDAETVAKQGLRELLGRLGFSHGFGETLDDVVSDTWSSLLDSWLKRRLNVGAHLERTRLHTPEHFNAICVDTDYLTFRDEVVPMPALDGDKILSAAFYLSNSARAWLEGGNLLEDEIDMLSAVNLWPERLFPGDRTIARPFAEFLDGATTAGAGTEARLEVFNRGMLMFAATISAVKIKELHGRLTGPDSRRRKNKPSANAAEAIQAAAKSFRCDAEKGRLESLYTIRNRCEALTQEERQKLEDTLIVDPWVLATNLIRFFSEGRYRPTIRLPFHGNRVPSKLLQNHARNIDSLRSDLREMELLSLRFGENFDVTGLVELLEGEYDQLVALSEEIEVPDLEGSRQARLEQGRKLLLPSSPPKTKRWGRIRPHLLFAYARDRGLLDNILFRRL